MKIIIETIRHDTQRYPTAGDWFYEDYERELHLRVSDLGDWRKEACVAVHELVEALICKATGVPQEKVDAFDLAHLDLPEPGNSGEAPYYAAHQVASAVEQLLAKELGVDWMTYNAAIDAL